MNFLQLAGHLGADAETRFTTSGQKVTTFRIATNSKRQGKEEVTWWRVTIWGDRFDKIMPYLKKGTAVIVYGELHKPSIYMDKENNPQVSLEMTAEAIRFSPFGKTNSSSQEESVHTSYGTPPRVATTVGAVDSAYEDFKDDPLPF